MENQPKIKLSKEDISFLKKYATINCFANGEIYMYVSFVFKTNKDEDGVFELIDTPNIDVLKLLKNK